MIVSSFSNWSEKQAEIQKYGFIILKADICKCTIEWPFLSGKQINSTSYTSTNTILIKTI